MNVIDHAILIPASPTFIWQFLGDLSQNHKWQDDYTTLSFLTSQREGRGTRLRYTTSKGNDVVIEITAWYDTLGYEYIIVDGSSVAENKGRIRLQEIAEGTLVQWTFNYELNGMFSGLRNSMGIKRSLTNNVQNSLRNLYKLIQTETGGISTHEAKALLQEAPDVAERSAYQPRHPSSFTDDNVDESFADSDYPSENPIAYDIEHEPIPEPPVADDDTKPNPVVQGTEEIALVTTHSEPEFLQMVPEPPVRDDDTKPNAPISDVDVSLSTVDESIDEPPPLTSEIPQTETQSVSTDIRDTSRISVFEVFGLQKPSETEEMRAITDADLGESEIESVLSSPPIETSSSIAEEKPNPITDEFFQNESAQEDNSIEHQHMQETIETSQSVTDTEKTVSLPVISIMGLRKGIRDKLAQVRRR